MAPKQKSDAPDPSEAMPGTDADTLPEAEAAQPDPQPVQSVIEHRSFGRPADEPVKVTTIRSN